MAIPIKNRITEVKLPAEFCTVQGSAFRILEGSLSMAPVGSFGALTFSPSDNLRLVLVTIGLLNFLTHPKTLKKVKRKTKSKKI
jgi:hypothetical protein